MARGGAPSDGSRGGTNLPWITRFLPGSCIPPCIPLVHTFCHARHESLLQVLAQRKAAVASVTSTTNWTDRFLDTRRFPAMQAVPKEVAAKYKMPPAPKLNRNQLRLVGYNDTEIDELLQGSQLEVLSSGL